jgi:hypothetical protein
MEHLDLRFEHFDELEQPLRRQAQTPGVAIGIRIILAQLGELAHVHLADERTNVLSVLVAWFGLGDRDLIEHRGENSLDSKAGEVAVIGVHAFLRPWTGEAGDVPAADPVLSFHARAKFRGVEQAEGGLEQRTALARVAVDQNVNRIVLHQTLERDGQGALGAADGPEKIEDLFAFLEALGRMPIKGNDLIDDAAFHAVELGERIVVLQRAIAVQAQQPRIGFGLHEARLADGLDNALRGERIRHRFIAA